MPSTHKMADGPNQGVQKNEEDDKRNECAEGCRGVDAGLFDHGRISHRK
jgi:hypothetical protein